MRPASRTSLLAVLAAALLAPACQESVFHATDPQVQLASATVWAGGDVVLTSAAFVGPDTLPVVLFGTDTALVRFVSPDTVVATAPDALGTLTLSVQFSGGTRVPVDFVRVAGGFTGWWEGPLVWGHPAPWPGGGSGSFLADGATHLLQIDAGARTYQPFLADSAHRVGCLHGPGPVAGVGFVLQAFSSAPDLQCGPFVAYRDSAGAFVTDTGPSGILFWVAAHLGPGDWLLTAKPLWMRWLRSPSGAVQSTQVYGLSQADGVAISPSGAYAVPTGAGAWGIPVFARGSLLPIYTLDAYSQSQGAEFSSDGDTLFMVATSADTVDRKLGYILAAIRAVDGTVVRSERTHVWSDNLLLDPNGKWIYSTGALGPTGPWVQVFDRRDLRLVATLKPPVGAVPTISAPLDGYTMHEILSQRDRTLHVVAMWAFGSTFAAFPLEVFSFKLLD